jgi:hypothetical protein
MGGTDSLHCSDNPTDESCTCVSPMPASATIGVLLVHQTFMDRVVSLAPLPTPALQRPSDIIRCATPLHTFHLAKLCDGWQAYHSEFAVRAAFQYKSYSSMNAAQHHWFRIPEIEFEHTFACNCQGTVSRGCHRDAMRHATISTLDLHRFRIAAHMTS